MRIITTAALGAALMLSAAVLPAAAPGGVVTVRNPIDLARSSETIVLAASEVMPLLAVDDVRKVHVLDGEKEVLAHRSE
jgi:hypothetical protein